MTNILSIFSFIINNLYAFFKEMSVQIICPFLIGCLFSFCWIIRVLYIIWICHLPGMWFANIFLQLVACLFIFLVVSFEAQKLILMSQICQLVVSIDVKTKNSLPNPRLWRFSSKSFIALTLILCLDTSWINFYMMWKIQFHLKNTLHIKKWADFNF